MNNARENDSEIHDIISRGVASFIDPDGAFLKKLKNNPEQVIIKFGMDPTRPDIHIGHAVILRKLRQFQNLGCKVIFLIGDYTAMIGDPSGKSKVRPEIDQQEIEKNMQTYLEQAGKILNTDPKVFSWIRNADWYTSVTDLVPKEGILVRIMNRGVDPKSFVGKAILFDETRMQRKFLHKNEIVNVSLSGFLRTLRKITHARLIERDLFQDRLKSGNELYMHEMMYPVMQGIDSHILALIYGGCDIELGGNDQTFNMLMARDVMKINNQKPQAVMAIDLIIGLDGKEKMSKSLDNYVAITDEPNNMYGKVMSIPDLLIIHYFTLATYTPEADIKILEEKLKNNEIHPKELKMRLAKEIVAIYHGEKSAQSAQDSFENTFSEGKIPDDIQTIFTEKDSLLANVLVDQKIVESKSEFRRLVEANAVHNLTTEETITDSNFEITDSFVLKVGKRKFLKIEVQ